MKYSLFFILISCSFFIDQFDKDLLEEKGINTKSTTKQTHCEIIQKTILISENQNTVKQYQKFIGSITKRIPLKFIDRVALWSMVQMNARPDLSSPTSKLQIFLSLQDKDYFFNAFSKSQEGFPQFYLLETLLKKFDSKYTLGELAGLYDQYFSHQLTVTKDFENFLVTHQLAIKKNPILSDYYIRGDESLREGETLPRISMKKMYRYYQKTSKINYEVTNFLFKSQTKENLTTECNFEMSLYENSIFLINDQLLKSHIFGYKSGQDMFFATASQANVKIEPIGSLPFFKGESNSRSAAMCHFKNSEKQTQMWFISSQSRDPGQHIFNLMEYGIENVDEIKSLDTMIKFSRHQFLKNPVRLVIESRRSSNKQIDELLKLNIPIYNSKKLGKIWGFYQSRNQSSFLLDDRRDGYVECNSN